MRGLVPLLVTLAVLSGLGGDQAAAQRGMGRQTCGGWGAGTPYARLYDPATVETVAGEVVSVDCFTPMRGMCEGVYLTLRTEGETIPVHIGPRWYRQNQEQAVFPHDRIEVTGSRIVFRGEPAIIARHLKRGGREMTLRDADGIPVWSGWRRWR